jgi:hypothetical protein
MRFLGHPITKPTLRRSPLLKRVNVSIHRMRFVSIPSRRGVECLMEVEGGKGNS